MWQWTPFMMLILLAGLQSRPTDITEAARVDGAGSWQIFRYLTLPHLRRYLELARAARQRLRGAELRRRLHHHLRRPGHRQPAVHRVPTFYQAHDYGQASAEGVIVVVAVDHRGDLRAADGLVAVPRGDPLMATAHRAPRAPGATAPLLGLLAWLCGIVFFLPFAWMVLTSLHSEQDAATNPPELGAPLTLHGYREFFGAGTGVSPWPPLINSLTASVVVDAAGAGAGHPGGVRAVDQAGAQVDRRDVLLPVHQDAARRGRAAAGVPDRARTPGCWTTSGCWSSSTPR